MRGADLITDKVGNKMLLYPIGETDIEYAVICTKKARTLNKVRWINVYPPKAFAELTFID